MIKLRLTEADKKKKKKVSGAYLTFTTGNPDYNCKMFNKRMGTDFEDQIKDATKEAEKEANAVEIAVDAEAAAIDAGTGAAVDVAGPGEAAAEAAGDAGASAGDAGAGDGGTASGEGGGAMGESLHEDTAALKPAIFYCVDPDVRVKGYYDPNEDWNGFAVPYFDKEDLILYFDEIDFDYIENKSNDTITQVEHGGSIDDGVTYKGVDVDTTQGMKHLYYTNNGIMWDTLNINESLEEAIDLDEDKMYVAKAGEDIDLPNGLHIIEKKKIEDALEKLEPEEEFEVGYATPVYFYSELKDKFTLLKCTRLLGYTGIDYIEARANDDTNRERRLQIAKDTMAIGNDAGHHENRRPLAHREADFSANYASANKIVKQYTNTKVQADGTITKDNYNTILFYPRVGSYPVVTYYLDIFDGNGYIKVSRELLEETILAAVEKIADDLLYGVTAKGEPKKHRWEIVDLANKIRAQLESDAKTIDAVQLSSEKNFETRSKISNGMLAKPQVRALYTNQIYFLKTPYETLGNETFESLAEAQELTEVRLDYATQLQKMKDTEEGTRDRAGTGIKAMSPEKLEYNWNICRVNGYTDTLKRLEAEMVSKGVAIPKVWVAEKRLVAPSVDDLMLAEFKEIELYPSSIKSTLHDIEYSKDPLYKRLKAFFVRLLYAITLGKTEVAQIIIDHICKRYSITVDDIKNILNVLSSDPEITSRLSSMLAELDEGLESKLIEGIKNLNEAKREVRRYYIRPQNIYCANKAGIIKALIAIGDKGENCSVYSLKNLVDNEDVHKLTNNDIIYYYDEGVLYDKNHVRIMDYDLYVKKEEKRKHFTGTDMNLEREPVKQEYEDRLTVADLPEVEPEIYEAFDLDFAPVNAFGETLTEAKGGICCICGEEIDGYGNNPAPVKSEGRCCDACNMKFVIPARMAEYQGLEPEYEEIDEVEED